MSVIERIANSNNRSNDRQLYNSLMALAKLEVKLKTQAAQKKADQVAVLEAIQILGSAKSFEVAELIELPRQRVKEAFYELVKENKVKTDGRKGLPTYSA